MRNQTTIENWILRKARDRDHRRIEPFIYPYNLGFKENFRQIFNLVGDGLTWPVRIDCDQYTLTREQLEQKFEKRQRAVRYKIITSYNGSFFPLIYDLHTCICIPYSNETRISVKQGDYVVVTRWENYWLYGTCITSNEYVDGWFPRCCVDEKFDIEDFWLLEKINFKISKKLS
jgi:palmitoyltransferase